MKVLYKCKNSHLLNKCNPERAVCVEKCIKVTEESWPVRWSCTQHGKGPNVKTARQASAHHNHLTLNRGFSADSEKDLVPGNFCHEEQAT